MKEIKLLAKLGEYQYMYKLLSNGELYFSPLKRFAQIEEGEGGIGDKFETGALYNYPPNPKITIIIDGEELELSDKARIGYHLHDPNKKGHIYCMSIVDFIYISEDVIKLKEPQKLENLGVGYDTLVIITDYNEFLKRIQNKVTELGYTTEYKPVSYFPEKDIVRKEISPFDKRERFAYQNEYRIYIDCDIEDSFTVEIGNIEDIAILKTIKTT